MPPKGKESIIRRQKEIARQQKQKEKRARREEKRTQPLRPGLAKGELRPEELGSLEDIIGPAGGPVDEPALADDNQAGDKS